MSGELGREADQLAGVPLPEERERLHGHGSVLSDLSERIAQRRLPGGILLHGPRGIGKATLAFAFARELLAATGDEEPHRIAEQVAAGVHPNVFVLRRTMNKAGTKFSTQIVVDQVTRRDNGDPHPLVERLHRTRGRSGWRIAIIDSIDDCNESAANALLKILEEPPAETLFVLVSHRPGQLLPTIHSRCHSIAMRPLGDPDVATVVSEIETQAAQDAIGRAVALAAGRPRRALEAIRLGDAAAIGGLQAWLRNPAAAGSGIHLTLADSLGADVSSAEASFARDLAVEWIAREARDAALARQPGRLASATELWEKAGALLADVDEINLDLRQSLVSILDAIRAHAQAQLPIDQAS